MSKYTGLVSEEIREAIEEYIAKNGLEAGAALPSERDMAAEFGVNRLSLRRALQQMADENVIYTKHGRGSFVAAKKFPEDTTTFISFSAGWKSMGFVTTSAVIKFSVVEAKIKVARALDISLGTNVFELQRVRAVNGEPISLETSYIPVFYCPGMDKFDFSGTASLYGTLEKEYGLRFTRQQQNIAITTLTRQEAELLHTEAGSSAFYAIGSGFSSDDVPLEYSVAISRSDNYAIYCRAQITAAD